MGNYTPNIGWLFYKGMFKLSDGESKIDKDHLTNSIKNILESDCFSATFNISGDNFFSTKMKTSYPGLLIGSGYSHEVGKVDENFKIGFFFDYTTGMPIIPGSSVKGVVRSIFKKLDSDHKKQSVLEYLNSILQKIGMESYEIKWWQELEKEMFEGERRGKNISIYERDKFFEAFVGKKEKCFCDDYITPHKDPLKDPKPLRFLKIAPNTEIIFNFEFHNGIILKEEKFYLIAHILKDFGIGAKINVGYGQFIFDELQVIKKKILAKRKEIEEIKKKEILNSLSPIDKIFTIYNGDTVKIIQAMQKGDIENYESIKKELALKVKKELQKDPKKWDKAKKKALKRRKFIENILADA